MRVLMVGLDASGKTSITHELGPRNAADNYAGVTIGFNTETWTYGNLEVVSFDIGGQDKVRVLYKHYYAESRGLIYVVDSNDRELMPEARMELNLLLADALLDGIPLLVLANKCDLPNHMTANEVSEALELEGSFRSP